MTVRVALSETPLEQSISGLYVPGASEVGSTTVVWNTPGWLPCCMGICEGSPSEEPSSVAEVHGLGPVPDPQLTVNVVEVPGADGFGKTFTAELPVPASATGALHARAATMSPAVAAAHLTRRMESPGMLIGISPL